MKLDLAGGCFRAIERRALESYTSSVWAKPGEFDPEVAGIERSLGALEAWKIIAMSIHYEIEVKGVAFAALFSVTRRRSGTLRARVYTRSSFFLSETASPREKFWALLAHMFELESLLQVSGVEIAANPGEPGDRETEWRIRI